MTNKPKKISLAIAMGELFKKANKLVYYSYLIQVILFVINIYLILNKPQESNKLIWSFFTFSIFIIVLSMVVIYNSKKYYTIGENLRKMDMMERIFPNAKNNIEKSYLLSTVPISIIAKSEIENNQSNNYYSSNRNDKYGKLIEDIQENSFFTSEIMRFYSKVILIAIIIILCLIGFSIIYGFFILSENNESKELAKSIAGYLALLINFIFALNLIDHYILFNTKSKELKRIDSDLNTIKLNPQEDDIVTFFSEYNCILSDSLPCPDFAYNFIKSRLNTVWNNRTNNG